MSYSSIQLSAETRQRLAEYKLPGMSYEDVIEVFLDAVSAAEFKRRYARARSSAARQALGDNAPDPAEAARLERDARWREMTPIERMEEAYRVSRLLGSVA